MRETFETDAGGDASRDRYGWCKLFTWSLVLASIVACETTAEAQTTCAPGRTSGLDVPLQTDLTARHFEGVLNRVSRSQQRYRTHRRLEANVDGVPERYFGAWFEVEWYGGSPTVCNTNGEPFDLEGVPSFGLVYGDQFGSKGGMFNLLFDVRGQILEPHFPERYDLSGSDPDMSDTQYALVGSWRHHSGWLGLQAGMIWDQRLLEPLEDDDEPGAESDEQYATSQYLGLSVPRASTRFGVVLNATQVEQGRLDVQWLPLGRSPWVVGGDLAYFGWEEVGAAGLGVGLEWPRRGSPTASESGAGSSPSSNARNALHLQAAAGYPGYDLRRVELEASRSLDLRDAPEGAPSFGRGGRDTSFYAKGTYFSSRLLRERTGDEGRFGGALGGRFRVYAGETSYWSLHSEVSLHDPAYLRLLPSSESGVYAVRLSVMGHFY